MLLSGFTFMRNTSKLYYPFIESIQSILPLVDEMIIALGDSDEDDTTELQLMALRNDKIKIIHTVWDTQKFQDGTIYAQQTDVAKQQAKGTWLLYLQSDEVIHEKYLPVIQSACNYYIHDVTVEGFLFDYKHFWGDYKHFNDKHGWYPNEIRIIRNHPDIHSFGDAQSFRKIPHFDGVNYRQKNGTEKLKVKRLEAFIFHYGWVRPPAMMQQKSKIMDSFYHDQEKINEQYRRKQLNFDYGNMNQFEVFDDTHPKVMEPFMAKFNWNEELHFEKNYTPQRPPLKHEKLRNRFISWIEKNIFNGKQVFGYKNWKIM